MFFIIYKYCENFKYNDIMVDSNTTNDNTNNPTNTPNVTSGGCVYDQYGRSPDGQTVCGVGLPSAANDTCSGFNKVVVKNECPQCHNNTIKWAWNFGGTFAGLSEGGSTEGHFFCTSADGGCDADYSIEGNEHINGSTEKLTIVYGPTPSSEEEARQLVSGQLPCVSGTNSGGDSSGGGSAVQIPDKTFYGLIKQICGGVDGIFTIANNMAYLLSFKDFYEYRDKFDEYITKVEASDILSNSLDKNWTTDGLYNTVEVTYSEGTIRYQNDALVQQYGQNIFYYEFPNDDAETAKSKADALLSAHIRDYGFDIYITSLYNPNITEGAWIKIPKKITNVSGISQDEYEAQKTTNVSNGLITQEHKGITISDIGKLSAENASNIKKIVKKDDKEIEIEVENNEYELFFVNAYTLRWDKNHSLIMDLHLKYGPDTPEDPVNATVGGSGGAGGGSGAVGGEEADINAFVQKALKGAGKDAQSKAQAIYSAMVAIVRYSGYSCSKYQTASECLQNAAHLNCADSSRLGRACYSAGGLTAKVVHGPNHFWVEVQINGSWVASDVTGAEGCACVRPLGKVYAGLTKDGDCGDNPSC